MNRGIWNLSAALSALLCVVAAVTLACSPPTEPGDINIFNSNSAVNNAGGPSTSASPGPGSDKLPEGSTIRVGIFGQDCPSGVTPPPNSAAEVKIACKGAGITATPKSAAGTDLDASVHGTQVEWAVTGGAVTCTGSYLGNVFNQLCVCPAGSAGATFSLTAKVKDKTGVLNGKCVA